MMSRETSRPLAGVIVCLCLAAFYALGLSFRQDPSLPALSKSGLLERSSSSKDIEFGAVEPDAVPVQKEFEQFDGIRIPLDFAANYGGKFDRDVSPEIVVLFGLSERERIGVAELILAEIESIGEHVQRKSERRKGGVFFVPAVEDSDRSGKFSNKLSLLLGPEIASALVSVPTYSDFVNDDLLGFLGEPKTLCVGEEDGVVVIYHGGGDCVEFSCLDYTAVYQNRPPPDWIRFLDP